MRRSFHLVLQGIMIGELLRELRDRPGKDRRRLTLFVGRHTYGRLLPKSRVTLNLMDSSGSKWTHMRRLLPF